MYIHLGGDVLIKKNRIVAIIDLEALNKSKISTYFLKNVKNKGNTYYIAEKGKEKALVITSDEQYLSPILAITLAKRSSMKFQTVANVGSAQVEEIY